ncbi:MAG: TrmH family RNA methyltransferase [Treponema sp.]|nr:TrmH family RNA methyltransferase [Treponema sp.]
MIPLYKLEKLPRTQKLRKIAKVLTMAERRLSLTAQKGLEIFTNAEISFFTDAAKLLAADGLFEKDAQKVFLEAADIFKNADDTALFRRALNNFRHILLKETGCEQADWDFICDDGKLDSQKRHVFKGMHVYMEDIRSPFNVGAMFRTAESFGVEKIILSPFCADPRHKRAERTAMGCIDIVPWERCGLFSDENKQLEFSSNEKNSCKPFASENKSQPLPVFALETGGTPLSKFKFPRHGILITGSEELGVSPDALAAADASLGRVSISCYGTKASLNVSVAFGIAIQAWSESLSV